MSNNETSFGCLVAMVIFSLLAPSARSEEGATCLLTISNESPNPLLLATIRVQTSNKAILPLFIGNLSPGDQVAVSLMRDPGLGLFGISALVEGKSFTYFFPSKDQSPLSLGTASARVIVREFPNRGLAIQPLAKKREVRYVTPISNVDLTLLTYDYPQAALKDSNRLEQKLRRLRAISLRIPHSPVANESDAHLSAYVIAFTNGWYSSLLGEFRWPEMNLISLDSMIAPYRPPFPPTWNGNVTDDPFDVDGSRPKVEPKPFPPQIKRFDDMIESAFKDGHKAGQKP